MERIDFDYEKYKTGKFNCLVRSTPSDIVEDVVWFKVDQGLNCAGYRNGRMNCFYDHELMMEEKNPVCYVVPSHPGYKTANQYNVKQTDFNNDEVTNQIEVVWNLDQTIKSVRLLK